MDINDKYGHWTVIDMSNATKANAYKIECRCICGNTGLVNKTYLIHGKSKSCGCNGFCVGYSDGEYKAINVYLGNPTKADFLCLSCNSIFLKTVRNNSPRNPCKCRVDMGSHRKHGESPQGLITKEYNTWRLMRQRCNSIKSKAYPSYGGRGISVCERWNDFLNFIEDMGRRPDGYSLDRIDVNGNYEPSNCRWATNKVQATNRRTVIMLTFDGVSDYLPNWADKYDMTRSQLYQRYRKYGDCGNKELMLRKGRAHAKR